MHQLPHVPDLVISDLHLRHRSITKYCLRDNHAAPVAEDVDALLVTSWNLAVTRFYAKHGRPPVILHLGDLIGWKSDLRAEDEFLHALQGDKYTFRGNHDHWPEDWMEEHGFKVVEPFTFGYKSWAVVLTHYPLRRVPSATINVHGHTHNNPFNSASRAHRNVSVECIGYMPRPLLGLVDSSIRLLAEVPDHIDYNADEATRALNNVLDLQVPA